jgi:hypothetical protein
VALRTGKTWSKRRQSAAASAILRCVIMNIIITSYIIHNAVVLSNAAYFCRSPVILTVISTVRWMGWNTLLFVLVIEAHGPVPAKVRRLHVYM